MRAMQAEEERGPDEKPAAALGRVGAGFWGSTFVYAFWTGLFLAVVVLLDKLKLHAIPGHATPFYALLRPFHRSWIEIAAVAPLVVVSGLVMRRTLTGRWPRARVWAAVLIAMLAGFGLFVWTVYTAKTGGPEYSIARALLISTLLVLEDAVPLFLAAIGVLAALLTFRHIRLHDANPSPVFLLLFLLGVMVFLFVFAGTVAELRSGAKGISQAYERLDQEYIADIGRGGSIRGLFAQFIPLHPLLAHHSRVHPPGPIALLWLFSYAVGRAPMALSLATMAFATLSVAPLFLWLRELGGTRSGLVAVALFVVSPGIVAFTATSADILFMPFTLSTLFLFDRALRRGSWRAALAAGVLYAFMGLCSFNLLCVGLYFGLAGIWELRNPDRRRPLVRTAALMATAFVGVYLAVYWWSGFNMIDCFITSWQEQLVDLSHQGDRWSAPAWWLLHPLSLLYYVGIPVSVLCVQRLRRPDALRHSTFVIMALTFLTLTIIVPTRGEMERTGLYLYPLLIAPAAHLLAARWQETRSEGPLAAAFGMLAIQSWLTEYLFQGYW